LPVLNADGGLVRLEYLDELLQNVQKNVNVVVMAGGRGTRLLPLTADCPKPMLKIGGRPILETIVRELVGQGMLDITISVNYLREYIVNYFGDGSQFGANINYLEEHEPMGTAGALANFAPSTDNVLVMNGDVLSSVDYKGLLDFHQGSSAACTMCVRKYTTQVPYGVVSIESEQIIDLIEKPVLEQYVNAGIYVLDAQILDNFKPEGRKDMTELVLDLINSDFLVSGFPLYEDWLDIGDMSELMRARDLFN
jgi:NDP-sugar pyrophosphorylase family protein